MDQYVTYNSEYQVLICHIHSFALAPESIERHFRTHHKETSLAIRQSISQYSSRLQLKHPNDVRIPSTTTSIKGLSIITGAQCLYEDCMELRGSEKAMEIHCREKHGWLFKDGIKWKKQVVQTFFPGVHCRYTMIYEAILTIDISQLQIMAMRTSQL